MEHFERTRYFQLKDTWKQSKTSDSNFSSLFSLPSGHLGYRCRACLFPRASPPALPTGPPQASGCPAALCPIGSFSPVCCLTAELREIFLLLKLARTITASLGSKIKAQLMLHIPYHLLYDCHSAPSEQQLWKSGHHTPIIPWPTSFQNSPTNRSPDASVKPVRQVNGNSHTSPLHRQKLRLRKDEWAAWNRYLMFQSQPSMILNTIFFLSHLTVFL
jgi:hypothetical protein